MRRIAGAAMARKTSQSAGRIGTWPWFPGSPPNGFAQARIRIVAVPLCARFGYWSAFPPAA
jgi:hypothetical protein